MLPFLDKIKIQRWFFFSSLVNKWCRLCKGWTYSFFDFKWKHSTFTQNIFIYTSNSLLNDCFFYIEFAFLLFLYFFCLTPSAILYYMVAKWTKIKFKLKPNWFSEWQFDIAQSTLYMNITILLYSFTLVYAFHHNLWSFLFVLFAIYSSSKSKCIPFLSNTVLKQFFTFRNDQNVVSANDFHCYWHSFKSIVQTVHLILYIDTIGFDSIKIHILDFMAFDWCEECMYGNQNSQGQVWAIWKR